MSRRNSSGASRHDTERAELDLVLASDMFKRAPNLSKLLRYVCTKYFEGATASIKEYNLAVEALGRPVTFDPAEDSIVRVEATRLRKRLRKYYQTEGRDHAVQIHLANSGYIPRFVPQARAGQRLGSANEQGGRLSIPKDGKPETSAPRPQRRRRLTWAEGLAAVFLMVYLSTLLLNRAITKSDHDSVPSGASESGTPPLGGAATLAGTDEIRISSGSSSDWTDGMGRVWLSDRYVTGGTEVARPDRLIYRTLDQLTYRTAREGNFRYDIPLGPGLYELHLHFAEIVYGNSTLGDDGTGVRRFNVSLNNRPLLCDFDIILDAAGPNTADEKVFTDVSPADDGVLHLEFSSVVGVPLLAGIEIMPGIPGKMRPVRIVASPHPCYDSSGQFWEADHYFLGGRSLRRWYAVLNTDEPSLYSGERWGHFSYAIPVAEGNYLLRLRFVESNFGVENFGTAPYEAGGVGSRQFDVYCNNVALLKNFDIFKEAGGPNRVVCKIFHGLIPNAQGKLLLSFVPVKDYPTVRAIEVLTESR